MEDSVVVILDKDFTPLAYANAIRTLIWDRRAKEPGMYELHCGAEDFEAIRNGAYVYRIDRDELGLIQERNIEKDASGAMQCFAKGYFAEAMLNDRVVDYTRHMAGTPEEIGRALVQDYFIKASGYDGRTFAQIELGPPSPYLQYQEKVQMQATGKPVGEVIYGVEDPQDVLHKLRWDRVRKKLIYEVKVGMDSRAIFSDEYSNIKSAAYHYDGTDAPNVVFVAGAGEGENRRRVVIDLRDDPGEYAREMYVDARDLQQSWEEDGVTKYYTDADYEALLEARGMEKLAGHKALDRFEIGADAKANLVYMDDYDIGDWCTVRVTVLGREKLELKRQITAVREVYEEGATKTTITFGDYGPRSLNEYVARSVSVNEVVPSVAAGGGEDLSKLETKDKSALVRATNEVNRKVGDTSKLTTKDKSDTVGAVNELDQAVKELQEDVGDLAQLETEGKASLVEAINEIAKGGGGTGGADPRIGDMTTLKTDAKDTVVEAINEVFDKAGSGGGGGGEDARIGDLNSLKTSNKGTVVEALNETFLRASPKNMGVTIAHLCKNNPSGATMKNFFGTGSFDAAEAYPVNATLVKATAPADGGAVNFSTPTATSCKQGSKTITLCPGAALYGYPDEATGAAKVSGKTTYYPAILHGAVFLVRVALTISSNTVTVSFEVPCDLVGCKTLTISNKVYAAYIPRPIGLPPYNIRNGGSVGSDDALSPFTYQPLIQIKPTAVGWNSLLTGVTPGENIFQPARYESVAALFTLGAEYDYNGVRYVHTLNFAGMAHVTQEGGTDVVGSFVKWLSTVHR